MKLVVDVVAAPQTCGRPGWPKLHSQGYCAVEGQTE